MATGRGDCNGHGSDAVLAVCTGAAVRWQPAPGSTNTVVMTTVHWAIDLAISFAVLGIAEALVKPIAKRWVQRRVMQHAPAVLALLDRQLPQLFGQLDGEQLQGLVRLKLEDLTGESWSDQEINQIFALYDPRITANHQQQ